MSDDNTITLEVDGEEVTAKRGQMLIEVTDKVGAYVPRFCYHEKLSVAANRSEERRVGKEWRSRWSPYH